MAKEDAVEFVKNGIKSQVSREVISRTLKGTGFSDTEIEEAFALVEGESGGAAPRALPVTEGPKRLMSVRELFSESGRVYKEKVGVMVAIAFVPFAATFTMVVVLQVLSNLGVGYGYGYLSSAMVLVPVVGLAVCISFIAALALIYALRDNAGLSDVIGESARKVWGYLWVSGLGSLITLGGLALGIIPGLLFGVWFSIASFIYVFEEERGVAVLLKSREYVRGYTGAVAWRFAVVIFFGMVVSFAVSFPFGLVNKEAKDFMGGVLQILITPFILIYSYQIYKNLVAMKPEVRARGAASGRGFLIFCAALGAVIVVAVIFIMLGAPLKSSMINIIMPKS